MKVLIGLEAERTETPPVLSLLDRLAFAEERRSLLSVVPPVASEGWHLAALLGDADAERRERVAVSKAERRLTALSPETPHQVKIGHPTQVLLAEAEKGFDLVAANASNRGALDALFTGSVARALVVGAEQSVLLARPTEKSGAVHAVFATDHSEYADRCVDTLLALAPKGIDRLTVLTACPRRLTSGIDALAAEMLEAANGVVLQGGEARNGEVLKRLSGKIGSAQTTFESVVTESEPREAIAEYMKASGADLLILGAKGHGPIERLTLGSVSFDQAIGPYPWSVLILRA